MPTSERHHANKQGILSRIAAAAGIEGTLRTFDRNNAVSVILMGALAPVAGSAISFLLGAFFLWGLISLAFGRFEFRLTQSDRVLAWTFTIFAALVLATGLIADNPLRAFGATVWLLPFLSLWVVIPRLRASPDLDYLRLYISGAIVGCISALLMVGFQIALFGSERFEGGAGNAAVFASMCLCLIGIAGLAVKSPRRTRRIFAVIAIIAGTVALIASLTRGVILALPPVLLLLAVYNRHRWRVLRLRPTLVLLFLAIPGIVFYSAWDMIAERIVLTFEEAESVLDGRYTTSAGERLRLWGAAWQAFLESPLLGHGVQGRMDALYPHLALDGLPIREFTHPHNAYLAFAVDGGIVLLAAMLVLLAAPSVVAWRAPRGDAYHKRLFMALIVATAYAGIGMTQIMFKHDIMDSFYIFTAIVIAASSPGTPQQAPLGKELSADRSRAGQITDRFFDFGEGYVFPAFVLLVVGAGMLQSFLPAAQKQALLALLGLSG